MPLIDTHAHLDEQSFDVDRDDVLARALAAGVRSIVTIGTTLASSRLAIGLAEKHASVYAAVGIHPNYTTQAAEDDFEQVAGLVSHSRVVAIGETGLDKYWNFAPLDIQRDYFKKHIELSHASGKPFIVHCREANAETLDLLHSMTANGALHGVMHSFCGDLAMAEQCLSWGMYISFAGMLTYKRNEDLRAVAAAVPLDRLLVETDSPYLSPVPLRGKRNEPAHVVHTARCLAEIRSLSQEEIAEITTANARRLLGIEG